MKTSDANSKSKWKCLLSVICLLSCVVITACGFQLRGTSLTELHIKQLSLNCEASDHWYLCQALKKELTTANIALDQDAELVLQVKQDSTTQRSIALSDKANAAEYLVTLTVNVELNHNQERSPLRRNTFSVNQTLKNREAAALQQQSERDLLNQQLYTRLAMDVVDWLAQQTNAPINNGER